MATIIGEEYGEIMEGGSNKDKLYGMGGDDTIYGYGGNDTLDGGDDNDFIIGGKGNDSLKGGDGEDIFVYASGDGNDIIADYSKEDKIQVTAGTISDIYNDGDDVIFKIGSGSITVKNASAIPITYIDADGVEHTYSNETVKYNTKGTAATLLASYTDDTFDVADTKYASKLQTINASETDSDIAITGNKLANVIIGGAGNNTLIGGKGNDTLTGGDGADTFVFGSTDGKDVITDYNEEDVIKFTAGTIKSVKKKGDDVIFTFNSSNTVTVKNGASKVITYVDKDDVEYTFPEDVLTVNKAKTSVTLLDNYVSEQFDVNTNAQVADYTGIKTINASAVDHDIEITGNSKANVIIGGKENNTLIGGKGNDTLTGGDGADTFVFSSTDGKDVITNYQENDVIKITAGEIANVSVKGSDVVFTFNKSNTITVKNAADKVVTYIDADGEENIYPEPVKWNKNGTTATLLENYSASSFVFAEQGDYAKTIKNVNASATDSDLIITGNGKANNIIGGEGNDTLTGGKGNDTLTGGNGSDVFVYNKGDGNDKILDYTDDDTISITGAVAKVADKGKDVIFTVGNEKISVIGAADKALRYFDADGVEKFVHGEPYTVSDGGKKVTLNEIYSQDTFDTADVNDIIKTIDGSAADHDIAITANKLANVIIGGAGNNTLIGGKGNDTLTGGDGADVFVYNKGDGNDKILDYTEEDVIQFTSGTVTAMTSGNNVIFTVKEGKTTGYVSVVGGKDHVITYEDSEGTKLYPAKPLTLNADGTAATLLKNYRATSFDANTNAYVAEYADILETIDGSAVTHKIEITGNDNANDIIGGSKNDTLIGGKGNDTLTGGAGQDIFLYNGGDGKDVITDYNEEDVIQIASGKITTIKNSGKNVVFTVGTGSISVLGGKGKVITYVDPDGVERTYPSTTVVSGETVTLTEKYYASKFDINDYDELSDIRNINATAVTGDLEIIGNSKANKIYGAAGDNTIEGGKGNDTLFGGDGANVYVYKNGDGNDLIVGFGSNDMVSISSGTMSGDVRVNGETVIFSVGKGKISLQGAADEQITYWYDGEKHTAIYPSNGYGSDDVFFYSDDADFGGGNDLSAIVQTKAAYSVAQADYSTSLVPKNDSLPIIAPSDKK